MSRQTLWRRRVAATTLTAGLGLVSMATGAQAVVGGAPATEGTFPFVAIISTADRTCSGVLVHPEWVLTAKSCFGTVSMLPGPPPSPTTVIVGRTDLQSTGGTTVAVTEVDGHLQLNAVLAKLAAPVTGITPVAIGAAPADGEVLKIAGYGRTATEWVPDKLLTATVQAGNLSATTFTIAAADGSFTLCQGDAGGPALRQSGGQTQLVGIHTGADQEGCIGSTQAGRGAMDVRGDVLDPWVKQHTVMPALGDPNYTNIARTATVTGSSAPGSPGVSVPAPGLNDGVRGTLGWSSSSSDTDHDESVVIAFSDVVAFNRIDIHPRTDVPAAQNNFPSNIKISIWPIPPPIPPRGRTAPADVADVVIPPVPPPPRDRDLWNHVVTRNNIPQSSDAQTFAFVGRASQYIRVKGLNLKQMQLSEIEVYNMHPSPNFEYQAPLPSIVEEWDYPGAEAVFTSRGVHLYKGDGHIMLVDCGPNPNSPPPDIILVQTFNLSLPGPPDFCFKAKGTSGYLTMEIGNAYVIRGESVRTIGAKVQTADAQIVIETEQVTPGEWQPVGIGQSRGDATILELRFPYAP